MKEFTINLRSVTDVRDFVGYATNVGFRVEVADSRHRVNGCSFMEMFCLDCAAPLTVTAQCTDEQCDAFREKVRRFVVAE